MRISHTGNAPLRSVNPNNATPRHPEKRPAAAAPGIPSRSLADRLAKLFSGMDIDVPQPDIRALADALSTMGYPANEIDAGNALRALLLTRNGVSLSPALLRPAAHGGIAPLLRESAALLDMILALSGQPGMAGSIPESLQKLADTLMSLLGPKISPDTAEIDAGTVERAFHRSGLLFEWKLLAWFRTGRDPGMLNMLLRNDLKGALLAFLGDMERLRLHGGESGGFSAMEEAAYSLLDHITGEQIDLLPETSGERRNLHLEMPFGLPEDRTNAGVSAEYEPDSGDPSRPAQFTMALDIETTALGTVRANLRFSGKTASAVFVLENREKIALAENMADEFREMLRARGYEPGIIRFGLREEPAGYGLEREDSTHYDRRG